MMPMQGQGGGMGFGMPPQQPPFGQAPVGGFAPGMWGAPAAPQPQFGAPPPQAPPAKHLDPAQQGAGRETLHAL